MGIPIQNAKDKLLTQNTGTMPNVSGAIQNWFQPMTFVVVEKAVEGFQNVETPTNIDFLGVWQPMTAQQLSMKPEGQRKWKWFTVHTQPGVPLDPDDVVTYLGTQYRVMQKLDYTLDGYIEYHLIDDYEGSGPA